MDDALFVKAAETTGRDCARLEVEIHAKNGELARNKAAAAALRGLRRSWSDTYAGKYGAHWFFVREYKIHNYASGRRHIDYAKFWVAAIADEPAKARDLAAQGKIALGEIADAKSVPCPSCEHPAPVVGRYEQTEDSWDGDTWETEIAALCLHCARLVNLGDDHKAVFCT